MRGLLSQKTGHIDYEEFKQLMTAGVAANFDPAAGNMRTSFSNKGAPLEPVASNAVAQSPAQ
jgi:hypothetical protein